MTSSRKSAKTNQTYNTSKPDRRLKQKKKRGDLNIVSVTKSQIFWKTSALYSELNSLNLQFKDTFTLTASRTILSQLPQI